MNDGTAGAAADYVHSSIPGRLLASSNGVISRALNNLSYTADDRAGTGATCSSTAALGGLAYSDLPCECGPDGRLLGSAAAYILKWTKVAIKKTANAYLSSPILLALLPLLVGCAVGFVVAWWWLGGSSGSKDKNIDGQTRTHHKKGILVSGQSSRAWDFRSSILLLTTATQAMLESSVHAVTTSYCSKNENENDNDTELARREDATRRQLSSNANTTRESDVPLSSVPKHIAVIMDGNRRYGRQRYGSATRGHWDGSKTLADFAKWCIAEG